MGVFVILHALKARADLLDITGVDSFDPCIACAVHVTDPDGAELIKVQVRRRGRRSPYI